MELPKDGITHFIAQGHKTLQVADNVVKGDLDNIDCPDYWFCMMAPGCLPVLEDTGGDWNWYLTRAGYEKCKSEIKVAWVGAGGDWSDFDGFAQSHFELVMRRINRINTRCLLAMCKCHGLMRAYAGDVDPWFESIGFLASSGSKPNTDLA